MAYGSFNSGGEALAVDATLKVSGAAADAKATGDALAGKADTNHSHDYLPLSGGTVSGPINFANGAWNTVGDDAYMGDHNVGGGFCIMGINDTTKLVLVNKDNPDDYAVVQYSGGNLEFSKTLGASITGSAGSVAWDNVTGKPPSYPPAAHSHDNWYYTKDEANRLLNSKSNTDHNHDGRYLPANGKASSAEYADSTGAANSVNGLTFAAQTTDPGAGSALESNKVLLVYQ